MSLCKPIPWDILSSSHMFYLPPFLWEWLGALVFIKQELYVKDCAEHIKYIFSLYPQTRIVSLWGWWGKLRLRISEESTLPWLPEDLIHLFTLWSLPNCCLLLILQLLLSQGRFSWLPLPGQILSFRLLSHLLCTFHNSHLAFLSD